MRRERVGKIPFLHVGAMLQLFETVRMMARNRNVWCQPVAAS